MEHINSKDISAVKLFPHQWVISNKDMTFTFAVSRLEDVTLVVLKATRTDCTALSIRGKLSTCFGAQNVFAGCLKNRFWVDKCLWFVFVNSDWIVVIGCTLTEKTRRERRKLGKLSSFKFFASPRPRVMSKYEIF